MTDPIPTKFCVGKEMTKLPQRSVKTTWDGSHPKKNYEWEEEQPRWTTSNYFKLGPPTPTATTAPTFPRPDGFAAGKKRKQGEPPPISCPHCGAIFSFFGGHCSSSRRHYIQFVWGETVSMQEIFFLISRRLPWFVITGNWPADQQPSHFIQGCLLFALFSGHARPAKKQLAAARAFE